MAADRRQTERLLAWANGWPERIWAVENVNGLGRLLSQQLVMAGEQVVDVPASLSHRTRKLSGKSGRKTDEHDARSVAIAAAHPGRLRQVELEDFSQALGLILDRRWHLVTFRHRTICRLHALLAEMVPGGAPKKLTAAKAAKILRSVRPATLVETERREVAKQLLEDWRWCNRRIPTVEARLHEALQAHGSTLTEIFGVGDVGAATILAIGLLRIDRAAIAADAKLDGKFLLRTSDPTLTAEDIALGYKQLLQVERGWRDLKLHLDLRPVFHRLEDRIRAHVLLCWLALLLTRIAENATGDTWRNLRRDLGQLAAIESAGPDGTLIETTRPTPRHTHIFTACELKPPPRFLDITPS